MINSITHELQPVLRQALQPTRRGFFTYVSPSTIACLSKDQKICSTGWNTYNAFCNTIYKFDQVQTLKLTNVMHINRYGTGYLLPQVVVEREINNSGTLMKRGISSKELDTEVKEVALNYLCYVLASVDLNDYTSKWQQSYLQKLFLGVSRCRLSQCGCRFTKIELPDSLEIGSYEVLQQKQRDYKAQEEQNKDSSLENFYFV